MVFIRTLIVYLVVIISLRIMGKRQLGELQPSDLVITILISNVATISLEDTELPLLHGIMPILELVLFEMIISWISLHSVKVRRWVSGSPKIIIHNGEIDQKVLHDLRFTLDDLMTTLRTNGIFSPEEVQFAIVETNGTVSILQKPEYQTATKKDVSAVQPCTDPPEIVIADGELREKTLHALGLDRQWIDEILKAESLNIRDIFLLTADSAKQYYLVALSH
ncbi:MAG TPA: DUF421 domain-containing protein [Ruminococcus sp.]|nr:DUF421 domain-containing protein [Ruminococcus sp.]